MPTSQSTNGTIDDKQLLQTLQAVKRGDFSSRMPADQTGMAGKLYDTLNEIIELNELIVQEFERVGQEVGREGKTKQRASVGATKGSWKSYVGAFNALIDDVVQPAAEVSRVIGAVASGDLTQTVPLEIEGRPLEGAFLRSAKELNTMVDQLTTFAREARRWPGKSARKANSAARPTSKVSVVPGRT